MAGWVLNGDLDYTIKLGRAGYVAHKLEKAVNHYALDKAYEKKLVSAVLPAGFNHIGLDHCNKDERISRLTKTHEKLSQDPETNARIRIQTAAALLKEKIDKRQLNDEQGWSPFDMQEMADAQIQNDNTADKFRRTVSLLGLAGKKSKKRAVRQLIGIELLEQSMECHAVEAVNMKTGKPQLA